MSGILFDLTNTPTCQTSFLIRNDKIKVFTVILLHLTDSGEYYAGSFD